MDFSDFSSGVSDMSDTESERFDTFEHTPGVIIPPYPYTFGPTDTNDTYEQGSPAAETASLLSEPLSTPNPLPVNKDTHLLKAVFSFLSNAEDRKHLVPLACTCKLFSELALNLLWEKQDSLLPLLKVLPTCKIEDDVYILSGHTTPTNLARLFFYTKRVISFTVLDESKSKHGIAQSTYLRLAQLIPSRLFPSLKHLHVPSVKTSVAHVFLFMSPSLRSVELGDIDVSGNASQIATSFIATLPWEAPYLNRFILRGPSHIPADALRPIAHFTCLETLELRDVSSIEDFTLFQELGVELSWLKTFLIDTRSLAYRSVDSGAVIGTAKFENLRCLDIMAPLSLINDLLLSVSSTQLDTLLVKPVIKTNSPGNQVYYSCQWCGEYVSAGAQSYCQWCGTTTVIPPRRESATLDTASLQNLRRLFETLHSQWHCSIHSLTIDLYDANQPSSSHIFVLPGDILQPLSQLEKLELLQVFNWKIDALNVTLQNSAPCWPKIRVLELPLDEYSSPISLSTLGAFAEHCPSLQSLQACVDAETIPDIATTGLYAFDHGLAKLSVGSLAAVKEHRNLRHVARYLNVLFPDIQNVQTHVGQHEDQWIQIHELLMIFQQVREDNNARRRGKV